MKETVAICQLNNRVAPRFDQCTELVLATIENGGIGEKKVLSVVTLKPHEVASLLNRLQVKALICGGVKEQAQKELKRYNIVLVDNVIGYVDDVLASYVEGNLKSGDTAGTSG